MALLLAAVTVGVACTGAAAIPEPATTPTATKPPTRQDAARDLETFVGTLADALSNSHDGESVELPIGFLDKFNAVAVLAERASAPFAAPLITAAREVASSTDRVKGTLRSDADYANQVRNQRQKINLLVKELQRSDYAQLAGADRLKVISVGPAPVTLKAPQVIMPLADFPLSGFSIQKDEAYDGDRGWRRQFQPTSFASATIYLADLRVVVLPTTLSPKAYFALQTASCESSSNTKPNTSAQVSAPASGDASFACRFGFTGDTRFDYRVLSRNVYVEVDLLATTLMSDGAALDQAVAIARLQLTIIDRVAPPN